MDLPRYHLFPFNCSLLAIANASFFCSSTSDCFLDRQQLSLLFYCSTISLSLSFHFRCCDSWKIFAALLLTRPKSVSERSFVMRTSAWGVLSELWLLDDKLFREWPTFTWWQFPKVRRPGSNELLQASPRASTHPVELVPPPPWHVTNGTTSLHLQKSWMRQTAVQEVQV